MLNAARRIQSNLSKCAAAGWDTVAIASKAICVWRDIDAALSPIIGHRGVAALLRRSVHLTRAHYPWLTTQHEDIAESMDFVALRLTLSQQSGASVATFNGAVLRKFVECLTNLIGISLAERLLRPVLEVHATGNAAKGPCHEFPESQDDRQDD